MVTPVETATSQLPLPVLVDGRAVADRTRVEAEHAARGLAQIETELAARIAEISALTAKVADLRNRLGRYRPEVMTVKTTDHRVDPPVEFTLICARCVRTRGSRGADSHRGDGARRFGAAC